MAKVFQLSTGSVSLNAALRYNRPFNTGLALQTTELPTQLAYGIAGVLSNLRCYVSSNTGSGVGTIRSRINTADGTQILSITSGATGIFEDASNTDSIDADDLISISSIKDSGTSVGVSMLGMGFTPGTSVNYLRLCTGNSAFAVVDFQRFMGLNSVATTMTTVEANWQIASRIAGTLKKLQIRLNSNTLTVLQTVNTRINGADGTIGVTVLALTTGLFEDLTNTDAIAVNDLINYEINATAGSGSGAGPFCIGFESSENALGYIGGTVTATGVNATETIFTGFPFPGSSFTEANINFPIYQAYTSSNLFIRLSSNGITATSTYTSRINGAAGNQTISIGSGLTGTFEDVTNTDLIAIDDLVGARMVAGGTGTVMVLTALGFALNVPSSATPRNRAFIGMVA